MSTQIVPYLYFNGNCREAMTFYHTCLGGELQLQAIKDTPIAGQIHPDEGELIMHAELRGGSFTLMASDMLRDSLKRGNALALLLNCGSEAELRGFFDALAVDGQVLQPVRTEFWGATFGQLIDKFGNTWMLNFTAAPTA